MSDMGIGEAALLSSIIGGGASIAGGALANKGSQTTSSSPTLDPAFSGLQGQVLQMVQQRLAQPLDTSGYTANGVSTINKTYDAAGKNLTASLTARGLNASPVAGAGLATLQSARGGDVANFQNSVPLLSRQLQSQDLSQATGILGLGRGSTSTGTVSSGGGAAGAATNLAQYLGYLTAKGAFKGGGAGLYPTGGNGTNYAPSPDYGEGY